MPEGSPLLPTGKLAAPSHTQASGRNPYQEMLLRTPQLSAPRFGEARSLSERWNIDFEAGRRMSILGAGEAVVFDRDQDEVDFTNPGDVEDYLRGKRIHEAEARYNAMRPARGLTETTVAVAAHLAGAALSPETFTALPTRLVTGGASALTRILRAGASGAAINVAIDPVVQALRIKAGLQEQYSPSQTALAAALGVALPGAVQTGIEAITAPARRQAARETASRAGDAGRRAVERAVTGERIPPTPVEGRFVEPMRGAAVAADDSSVIPRLSSEERATLRGEAVAARVAGDESAVPSLSPEERATLRGEGRGEPPAAEAIDAQRIEAVADEIEAINRQAAPDIADDIAPAVSVPEISVEALVARYRGSMAKAGVTGENAVELEAIFRVEAERIVAERAGRTTQAAPVEKAEMDLDAAMDAAGAELRSLKDAPIDIRTPEGKLKAALQEARGLSQSGFDETLLHVRWAMEAGRPDVAETIVRIRERSSSRPVREPGVAPDSPRYAEVKAALEANAARSRSEAKQLRAWLDGATPARAGRGPAEVDDTAALVREVAPGPAARAVKRVDGKFVPVIDVDGETFHLRVDGEWHKGEPAQSVMIAGRGARTDQTTAAYRTVESAVEAAQSELGFRGRPPATSDIDAAVSAEAAPVAATQPKAPEFRDTRGEGLRLHGTPSEDLPLDEGHYTTKNFYGQGVYTTDAVDIAAGYAGRGKKTSGSDGTVFVVRPREGLKVLDMEEPVPAWIVAHVDQDRSSLGELAGIALEEGPTNLRELYDTIRDISREEGRSADDVQEIFEAFQEVIQAQGFHGMRHVGGLKTKKAPHDVTIYFNSADVTTEPLDLAEFRVARGAETAASASARLQAVLDQRRHATRVPTPEEIANRPIAGGATARFAPGQDTHAFVGQLRGRPFRGESGRATTGVPEAAATPQAERLRDISERVVAALGLTVRQGRLQRVAGKKPLGTFNEKSGVVRMRELDAFDVLAHEGGHGLHLMPEFRADIDALIGRHQIEVERLAYPGTPQGQEGVEGFAEWFRLWLTNPGYAKREAPQFTEAAENWLRQNRPRMLDDLVAAQSAYREWLRAPSRDVVTGDLVSSGAPPIKERVGRALETDRAPSGESLMSMFGRFYTWTLDRLHPVNRSVRVLLDIHKRNTGQSIDLPAASDPYKLLRLATSAHQAGHIDLLHGVVPYRSVEPQGPSLAEGLELAVGKNWHGAWRSDELIDFGAYLVARRSVIEFHRFMAGEVPNPPGKLTLGDYRQAVSDFDAAYPNFAHAAQLIYKWQTNLLKKKFEAGLVSRSYYDKALAKPDYVPFQRDFSEKVEELIRPAGAGGTNRQSAMKTYRGSLRSIINPIESMMSEAYSTAAIIARNDAITMLADLAKKAGPGGGAIAEAIPASVVTPIRVDVMQALRNAGKDAGLDKADIDDLVLAASERLDAEDVIATLYKAGDAPEKGEPIVYYWRGGERHALRLADRRFGKDLYEAITQLGAEQSNWIINLLAVPARTLRMGITTSPEFLLANYIRDQTSAFVLNTRFVPFVSGARGMVDEIAQTRAARLYSQAGGLMGGANTASLDQARIGRNINALRRNGTIVRRVSDIRDVIRLTEISESGTRIALFKQYFDAARKQGLSEYEAMVEGAFQARDFIDFGRHGSKMLFARRIVTFMNAALQGTDKTLRTLINDMAPMAKVFRGETLTAGERALVSRSAQAWLKIGVLTGLSATYALMYRDDPEWQQAGEYLRATHWLFKMPGGEWAVVPKPFEMATIMNFGERFAEGLAADDPTWANKWLRSWGYTLAVPIEPAGLMTPAEIGFNFDVFRQMPIVPQWDQGLEPWQQFNQYTSEFSKMVGKAINVSPAKIDHLIVGWTGSWGRNALSVSNMFDPQRRSEQLYDWPISGRFVKNLARGSDATDKFYGLISETGGRLERRNNAYNEMISRGQEDQASKFYDTLSDDEKVWVALNTMESADEKRLHPLRRASDVLRVFSGMRRDVAERNIVAVLTKRKIDINPTIASAIADQLGRWAAAESRNAMIVVGEPGWAQREIMDVSPYMDAIRQLSPEVAVEIEDRLRKSKVLPFEGVRTIWPELRQRLLDDGPDAFVRDLRGDAMGVTDRPAQAPEVERTSEGEPTTIRRGAALGNIVRGEDGRIAQVIGPDGRVLADVRDRDSRGRIRRVRTGILDRAVVRDEDDRAMQLAA